MFDINNVLRAHFSTVNFLEKHLYSVFLKPLASGYTKDERSEKHCFNKRMSWIIHSSILSMHWANIFNLTNVNVFGTFYLQRGPNYENSDKPKADQIKCLIKHTCFVCLIILATARSSTRKLLSHIPYLFRIETFATLQIWHNVGSCLQQTQCF